MNLVVGSCPFCKLKQFRVYIEAQSFRCNACGKSGETIEKHEAARAQRNAPAPTRNWHIEESHLPYRSITGQVL